MCERRTSYRRSPIAQPIGPALLGNQPDNCQHDRVCGVPETTRWQTEHVPAPDPFLPDASAAAVVPSVSTPPAYSLLAAIGRDCVGALQFLPDGADPGPAGGIEGRLLEDEEIAAILVHSALAITRR
jgi:hypothetical protein